MFKLYDKAFKIGFGANTLVFVILNIFSYFAALAEDERIKSLGINFGGSYLFWGFPFNWFHYWEVALNIYVIASSGFAIGLISRFIWEKLEPQYFSLKSKDKRTIEY